MAKQLLIERALAVHAISNKLCESTGRGYIVEETAKGHNVLMTVKLPATTLDKKNENQRTYRRVIMDSAMTRAKPEFESRSMLSSVNEHPDEPYVTPGQASHIVTAAWCENDGYLWNRWDVMNTASGRDLAALIEAGASFGVSIRGLGSQDNTGNILDDYEYLGTDCVGQPSAKIRTAPSVESQKASTTESTAAQQPIVESNRNVTVMKNRAEAVQYVREAAVLMQNEGPMEAMRRVIRTEAALAECSLPAADLIEAYQVLESCKTGLNESASKPGAVTAPAAMLTESGKAYRAKLVELANNFKMRERALLAKLEKALLDKTTSTRTIRAMTARMESLTRAAARGARSGTNQGKVLKMSEASRVRLHRENANLKVKFAAASDLAVRSTVESRIAITEAAKATVKLRRMERAAKKPAVAAVVKESVSTRTGNVVRTNLMETGGAKAGITKGHERNVTSANRDGTTKIPGFM
jgi:hypothetical protein